MESDSDRHERIRTQYYNGLDWSRLNHDERYRFIFVIEAAAYCEAYHVDDMRRVYHEKFCDQALNRIPSENRDSFGGSYRSVYNLFKKDSDLQIYLEVKKAEIENGIQKRNSRIIPHIPEIKQLVQSVKTAKNYMRVLKLGAKVAQPPLHIFEPRVKISELLGRQTSKARAPPNESVSVSDRLARA